LWADNMSEKNQHWGSTLDDFLHEEGIYEAVKGEAVTRVISWQIAEGIQIIPKCHEVTQRPAYT